MHTLNTPHNTPYTFPSAKAWSIDSEEVIGIRKLITKGGKELWQVCFWSIVDKEPAEIVTFCLRERAQGYVQGMAYAAGEGLLKHVHELEEAQGEPSHLLRVRAVH